MSRHRYELDDAPSARRVPRSATPEEKPAQDAALAALRNSEEYAQLRAALVAADAALGAAKYGTPPYREALAALDAAKRAVFEAERAALDAAGLSHLEHWPSGQLL